MSAEDRCGQVGLMMLLLATVILVTAGLTILLNWMLT